MSDTFDPNDFKQGVPFDPSNFGAPPPSINPSDFKEQVVNLEDLPEGKRAEYEQFLGADTEQDQATEESNKEGEEALKAGIASMLAANKVELTDEMREAFMRSLLSNKPYQQTYVVNDDLSITFRTLTVKEYDAIADAVGQLSMNEGYVNAAHLKFVNFRYTVSSAITSIQTKDEEDKTQIFNYKSPLEEDSATHREEIMTIKLLDGATREKTVTVPITDADRVLTAHQDRFDNVNSTLYNVLLNIYTKFDREVNELASELYSKNFTAPTAISSF